jgi:site-specific recombinase XerD
MVTDLVLTPAGIDVPPPLQLYDASVDRFLETRNSARTMATYRRALADYREHSEALNVSPFQADAIIAYNATLQAQRRDHGGELANDTIRLRLKAIQSLMTWCYAFGLSPLKPQQVAMLLTIPPARKLSPRDILTNDEAARLLAVARPGPDRALVRLMLDAGLRVSEALALLWDDIYSALDRYWILVRVGKGDKQRELEVGAGLWHDLETYRKMSRSVKVFRFSRTTAWRVVARLTEAAGIDKPISPHSLRHTHAHHLRLAGWPLEMVADRLGHASIDTTKLYTRPAEMSQQISLPEMPWDNGEETDV